MKGQKNRNKVRPIKKLTDLQKLSTTQLLGYADIAHSSMNEVMIRGKDLFNLQYLKLISAKDNKENLDKMQQTMNEYSTIHNEVVIEIGNRFKKDMKLSLAPIQITQMVEKMKEKFPALAQHDSQTLTHMAQEKAAKDRAEVNRINREKEDAKVEASKKEGPENLKGKIATPEKEEKVVKLNPKK